MRGQAALDFLMTYGWAIALVVIIAAVLFSLGIFDVTNFIGSKAAGFSGVSVKGWQMTPTGTLSVKLTNQVGNQITITGVNATVGSNTTTMVLPANESKQLSPGQDSGIWSFDTDAFGTQSSYLAKLSIKYTDDNGFSYTSTGTLTGKAS